MEAPLQPLAATTPACGRSRRLLLLPLLLFLLPAGAQRGWEAEERPRTREEECHFYAGGQVYPGEASRVSVGDHSLHLSKAKSRWCPAKREGGGWQREAGGGEGGRHVYPGSTWGPGLGGTLWAALGPWPGLPGGGGREIERGSSCEEKDGFHESDFGRSSGYRKTADEGKRVAPAPSL